MLTFYMGAFDQSADMKWTIMLMFIFSVNYGLILIPWYIIFNKLIEIISGIKSSLFYSFINITLYTIAFTAYYYFVKDMSVGVLIFPVLTITYLATLIVWIYKKKGRLRT